MDATTNNFWKHFVCFTHGASTLMHTLQKCLHKLHGNTSANFTIPVIAQDNICLNLTTLGKKKKQLVTILIILNLHRSATFQGKNIRENACWNTPDKGHNRKETVKSFCNRNTILKTIKW